MILSNVNIGSGPSAGDGDPLRSAFIAINNNFQIVKNNVSALTNSVTSVAGRTGNVVLTVNDIVGLSSAYASQANITTANTAMRGYVDAKIAANVAALVDSAPGILDTLNELAAALNDDANFSSTVVTLISNTNSNITLANTTMKAYVDGQITAANAGVTAANIGVIGYVDQANTIQSAQVNAANLAIIEANLGMQGYVDRANTIQSQQISSANLGLVGYIDNSVSSANLGMKGYVDSVASQSIYGNVNVQAYTETMGFQNFGNVNVAAYVTTANSAIVGYIDQANTIQSQQIASANIGIIGYVDLANTIQSAQIGAANLAIIEANLGMKGYVDSVASQSIYGNANVLSYLTQFDGNIIPSANVTYSLGNVTNRWKDLYLSGNTIFLGDTTITTSGGAVLTPVTRQLFSQSFLPGSTNSAATFTLDRLPVSGSTRTVGVIGVQGGGVPPSPAPSYTLTEGVDFTISGLSLIITASYTATNISCTESYSDTGDLITATEIATDTISPTSGDLTVSGNITVDGDLYVSPTSIYMGGLRISAADGNLKVNTAIKFSDDSVQSTAYSNVKVATYLPIYSGNIANIRLGTSGVLTFADGTTQTTAASGGGGSYGNANVASYLPTYSGVVTASNVAVNGNVTAQYLFGNGSQLTGIVGGAGNYGNIDVKAFLETDAGPGDGFERKIEGYYANIILGDTTKLFSYGSSSKSYFGHEGSGNTQINYVRADNGDVRIATNNGAYNWIFDNTGNLTLPGATAGETIATSGGYITVGNLLIGQGGSLFNSNNDSWALYGNLSDPGTSITIPSNDSAGNGQPITIENQISNVEIVSGSGTWTFDNTGNLIVPGSIIPSANVTYDLGDNTHRWRDLYLSGTTITLGDATISAVDGKLVTTGAAISPPTGAVGFANVQLEAPTDFAQIRSYYVDNNFGYTANLKNYASAPIVWDELRSAKFYENSLIIGGATPDFSALDTSGGRFANAVATIDATGNIASLTITDGGVGYDSYYPYYATDPTGYDSNYIGRSFTGAPTGDSYRRISLIPTTASDVGNITSIGSFSRYDGCPTVGSNSYTWTGNTGTTISFTVDWSSNTVTSYTYTSALPALTSANDWQNWILDYQNTNDYGWWIGSGGSQSLSVSSSSAIYDYLSREALPNSLTYDLSNTTWYPNNLLVNNSASTATLSSQTLFVSFNRTAIGWAKVENSYGNPVYWLRGLSADTGISSGGDMTVAGDLRVTGDLYVSPDSIYLGDLQLSSSSGNLVVHGNVTANNVTTTGNVSANYFVGNGALLTGITVGGAGNYSNVNVKAYTETMGFQNFGNVNVAAYVTTANSAVIGYVDNAVSTANVGVIGYIDRGNTIVTTGITTANVGMKGYVDAGIIWSISASGSTDYVFSGPGIVAGNTNDPVLYLYKGFTYTFINTTGGSHPFAIRVSNGGADYTSGVSGSQTGTQIFTVPMDAPSTLYYQCTIHGGMGNTINIV